MNVVDKFGWPPEAVERLVALADGTRSAAEIAAEMKLSRSAVIGKFHRLRKEGATGKSMRLLPGFGGSHGRNGKKRKAEPKGKVQTVRRLVPAQSEPKPPTFLKTRSVAELLATAPEKACRPQAPMPFGEAIEKSRCLFFAGDPYAPPSPDMPVCGAERLTTGRVLPPYCRWHLSLRYVKRSAA